LGQFVNLKNFEGSNYNFGKFEGSIYAFWKFIGVNLNFFEKLLQRRYLKFLVLDVIRNSSNLT
jgi:hypothetical protein